jgi:hypothetical protein
MIASLVADALGLGLLLATGAAGIWSSLWIFWAESAAAYAVAAVTLRRGMQTLSDDAFIAQMHAVLDAKAARGRSLDESPAESARDLDLARARLAAFEALDRRTAAGQAEFDRRRSLETGLTGGVFGCAFAGFPVGHAVFLLLLGVVATVLAGSVQAVWSPAGIQAPADLVPAIDPAGVVVTLVAMAAVAALGLRPLRAPASMAAGDTALRRALLRLAVLQATMMAGGVLALVAGNAGIAIAFTVAKTAVDLLAARRPATP